MISSLTILSSKELYIWPFGLYDSAAAAAAAAAWLVKCLYLSFVICFRYLFKSIKLVSCSHWIVIESTGEDESYPNVLAVFASWFYVDSIDSLCKWFCNRKIFLQKSREYASLFITLFILFLFIYNQSMLLSYFGRCKSIVFPSFSHV